MLSLLKFLNLEDPRTATPWAVACILRPRSVVNTDMCLWSFAGFLVECAPGVHSIAEVSRRCACSSSASDEWGWAEAPARVPMFPGDVPRQDKPLPKALDDATAAKLLRAARNDRKPLVD